MAKMGRPKLDVVKNHKVSIRLSDEEYERLKAYAKSQRTTITQILQRALEKVYEGS